MDDRAGGMGLIFLTADREPICEADQQSHIRPARHSLLKGIGPTGSAVMAREVYYRQFSNRRQIAGFLGLATSPYDSGQVERSQGISRAGTVLCGRL
jgi:transposase